MSGSRPGARCGSAASFTSSTFGPSSSSFAANGVASTVVGCTTDTMTPTSLCRELAALIGAEYGEVDAADGHIWPVSHPDLLRAALSR